MAFLYEEMDAVRKYGGIVNLPEYIAGNLNQNFELRDYQQKAFENFITYLEKNPQKPTQVLFHMATGSGKTLIMAGLMLYLYKQGYRNFLFFVNLKNVLEKTRDNFLNSTSSKYLFADEIIIDGEKIRINVVENFQYSDKDTINICFVTTQKLHTDMFFVKENGMSFDDFDERKVVLISDEAHHLNVDKRNMNKDELENHNSWEQTVKNLFKRNSQNILLEFTATCDLANENIKNFYEDKIVFNYPLKNFYDDKYSKDIITLRSDFSKMDKALQALVLSQYRLKVFQDNQLSIKPVILFKLATIEDNKNFMSDFICEIKKLNGNRLLEISKKCNNEIMHRAFEYFSKSNISFDMLAAELKDDFSEQHCISANNEDDACKNQLLLNSLEDVDNPYRAIFEVKKLDEGWDVLNLFDIVRLYETRQSGGNKVSPVTIAEAQLIGRGARYCPFKIDEEQSKFQRKFDENITCDLRTCETLYYHCQNDSRYIAELKKALKEIGLDTDKIIQRKYILKESFKKDKLYKQGLIFLNDRIETNRKEIYELMPSIRDTIYNFQADMSLSVLNKIMSDNADVNDKKPEWHIERFTIKEIAAKNYAIINEALMKYPIYKFDTLKSYFPNLKSTRQFITDENYLGNIKIDIKNLEPKISPKVLHNAVFDVLGKISDSISKIEVMYKGTKEFYPKNINSIFHDKIVKYSELHDGGIGISQNDPSVDDDLRIDLSAEDWYTYTDNFGTSEEKAFVAYFRDHINDLKKIYNKIFLIRNERAFHIYSFENGERFEPDYVLFLQKNTTDQFEQLQIFIEPKGTHLLEKDAWKEKFLLKLKNEAISVKTFVDDVDYKIWGFSFFNREKTLKNFNENFSELIK